MTNMELQREVQPTQRMDPTDRDVFRHYEAVLGIEVQMQTRPQTQREAIDGLIDLATEAGYTVDHLEAIQLLEHAQENIYEDGRFESNFMDGTWDENGQTIDYDNADKTGEQ